MLFRSQQFEADATRREQRAKAALKRADERAAARLKKDQEERVRPLSGRTERVRRKKKWQRYCVAPKNKRPRHGKKRPTAGRSLERKPGSREITKK